MTRVIVTPREGGAMDITVVPGKAKHLPPIQFQVLKGGDFKTPLREVLEVYNPTVPQTPA